MLSPMLGSLTVSLLKRRARRNGLNGAGYLVKKLRAGVVNGAFHFEIILLATLYIFIGR